MTMMAEYISKDKFIHFLFKEIAYFEETQTDIEIPISATLQSVVNEIKKFTSEDVATVKHGRWIQLTQNVEPTALKCSLCGEISCCRGMYCPDCGARMDGEENG